MDNQWSRLDSLVRDYGDARAHMAQLPLLRTAMTNVVYEQAQAAVARAYEAVVGHVHRMVKP